MDSSKMNISILIPSKNNQEKLNQNINKSSFGGIFKKVHYYILVDSEDEKKQYLGVIKNDDVTVMDKLLNYQSQRYSYLLNTTKSDYYMFASDDIIIEAKADDIKVNTNIKIFHAINENKHIINHPIISDKIKNVVGFKGSVIFDPSMPDGSPRKLMSSNLINTLGWYPTIDLDRGLEQSYRAFLTTTDL